MPKRSYSGAGAYRYGFNGKENDNDVKGLGNQQDYGMRIYDSRLGRFLSVDPITREYPMLTPYQFASNSPISAIDLDGLEGGYSMNSETERLKRNGEILLSRLEKHNTKPKNQSTAFNIPIRRQQTISTGIPFNSNSFQAKNSQQMKRDYAMNVEMEKRAAADPISYGGPGFGRGLVRDPFVQASATILCPECGFAFGALQVKSGIETGNTGEIIFGALGMIGGGIGSYGRFSSGSASRQLVEMEASSGSHYVSRHGAQTSLSSQYTRAISGLTPDGVVLGEVNASRFLSSDLQLEAINSANARFAITGEKTFTIEMNKLMGEGFLKGGGAGSYRVSSQVQAVFKNGRLETIYPLLKK